MLTVEDEKDWDQAAAAGLTGRVWPNIRLRPRGPHDARLGEEAAAEESVTPARSKLVAEPSDEVVARCGMGDEGQRQHFD